MRSNVVFVGNVDESMGREQLKKLFRYYGKVKRITLLYDRGFGFVEMGTAEEAETVIRELNGFNFKGRVLSVKEAKAK